MEIKAYIEGILHKWWLVVLVCVLSLWIGSVIGNSQTNQYTASSVVLLNSSLLANTADPANVVQLSTVRSYESQVAPPAVRNYISKHYPRISFSQLQKDIVVTTDLNQQLLLISVTDISPTGVVDITNYLTLQFVKTQNSNLKHQLDYYENWLQQNITSLTQKIDTLNFQLQQLIPPPAQKGAVVPVDPQTQRVITTDQNQLDRDERDLYRYERALRNIRNTRPLFKDAYDIVQPATAANVLVTPPLLPTGIIQLIAVGLGLFAAIILIITVEYFTPVVRHRGELQRIAGFSVLTESPKIFNFEQKHLLQLRPILFRWRMNALYLLTASIGASAVKDKGCVVLLTSPRRKRNFAAVLATFLAHDGHQTLLVDADFEKPFLHKQIQQVGRSGMVTNKGLSLSFMQTAHPHLFVLPANTMLSAKEPLTSTYLIELLPELQKTFSIIIIDAPPLNRADTHLLATRVTQTLLLVKKRRDSLKVLKMAHMLCQELKLNARCLLLA